MNQSKLQLKGFSAKLFVWFCRFALITLVLLMTYVVTKPAYNYAHWVPRRLLQNLSLTYENILWLEQNGDYFLHFFGALLLTWLVFQSNLPCSRVNPRRSMLLVILLCVAAEATQFWIGRGVESSDLLLGILGSFMAYLAIVQVNSYRASKL